MLNVRFKEKGFVLDFEGMGEIKKNDQIIYDRFLEDFNRALFYFGFEQLNEDISLSIRFLHRLSSMLLNQIAHTEEIERTRESTEFIFSDEEITELLISVPFALGNEYVNEQWLIDVLFLAAEEFKKVIRNYKGTVQEFLVEQKSNLTVMGRIYFHLVENPKDELPFAFLATYTSDAGNYRSKHIPLKSALTEYKENTEKLIQLLSTVSKAQQKSELISNLLESGELFSPLKFTSEEAYTFLKEIPLYEESGILCRIPNWWKKKQNRLGVSVHIGETGKSRVGADALLSFDPQLSLGGEKLTKEELEYLLSQSEGLVWLKGKWVEVDHSKLSQALEILEKAKEISEDGSISIFDALKLELNTAKMFGENTNELVEVTNGEWLDSVLSKLRKPELIEQLPVGPDFNAILRKYQQDGLSWLNFMIETGFGACLADDMGLGKTIQIIGLLEFLRSSTKQTKPSLLIVPASLIGNWQKELEKFTPKLTYKICHGKKEEIDNSVNLYITTYTMVSKLDDIMKQSFNLLILDEAQAIKNPGTKQTKAVKQINARSKIAMTGTPIENRLTDLWSLFDFLNSGLLGSAKEFKTFTDRLIDQQNSYANLRSVVSPFILRRLKTDKAVISDLPDKVEMKDYVQLSKKQVVLYQKFVEDLEEKINDSDGISRKGLILASILKLKQICNHPDHYLGQSEYSENQSGKFEVLRQLCETIYEKRERVLIFTQFKEIIEPLNQFLTTIFEREGLILHGGTAVKKRQELVDKFNGEKYVPFMILSLKAGGVGLNLTSANHVIHFDRWWNPAVENQATDRAFRIGQSKNVMVHKFITKNTVEEKIDLMIEDKVKLSSEIISDTGESWITKMSNEELMDLFRMVGE